MQEEKRIEFMRSFLEGGLWAIISMVWYKLIIFRCWEEMTYIESQLLLWGIVIGMIFLGALMTCYNKDGWCVTKTLLIAYGSYTMLTYGETIGERIKVIFCVSTIVTFLYGMLVMFRKIRAKRYKNRIIMKRLYKCIYAYLSIVAMGMGVLLCSIVCPLVIGNSLLQSSVKPTNANTLREQTIANNMDMLLFLQDDKWNELNVQEKLDVMQTVANIESYYLGIPNELFVSVVNLKSDILGSYVDGIHTIYINLAHLENGAAHEVLNTCLHEAFHSYQYRLIDAYNSTDEDVKSLRMYKRAVSYIEEFSNYIDGNKDFNGYYEQLCETDARNYAEDAVEDYYNKIYKYLGVEVSDLETNGKTEADSISYDGSGNLFLLDENNRMITGTYKVIEDDFSYRNSKITCYIGKNRLYGEGR